MAEKTLELKLKARDETRAAMQSAGENADKVSRDYEKLDRQVRRLRRDRANKRIGIDRSLDQQHLKMLDEEKKRGITVVDAMSRRLRINMAYKEQRRALVAIARDETATDQQQIRARQMLVELNRRRHAQLNHVNVQMREEARLAAETAKAEEAKATADARSQLNRARRERAGARLGFSQQLDQQQIRNLEREKELGSETADVEMRRIKLDRAFRTEREGLLRVARSELASDEQRIRAKRLLAELDTRRQIQMAGIDKEMKRVGRSTHKASDFMHTWIGSFTVIAGASMMIRGIAQQIEQLTQNEINFNNQMTELLSLGDNLDHIRRIKGEVLSLSDAWGITYQQASSAMFRLQSGTANLSKTIREDLLKQSLLLTKVYGGDLEANIQALIKNFQIVRHQGESVADVTGILAKVAEDGNLSLSDLSDQMPDVSSKADAVGASFKEAAAAIEVASQRGGKTEKVFTSVGNVFLRMAQAGQHGVTLTGSLTDKLRQLSQLSETKRLAIFGTENIAAANTLINSIGQIRTELHGLSSDLPDLQAKMEKALADPAKAFAAAMKSLRSAEANTQTNLPAGIQAFLLRREALMEQELATRPGQIEPTWLLKVGSTARSFGSVEPGANAMLPMIEKMITAKNANLPLARRLIKQQVAALKQELADVAGKHGRTANILEWWHGSDAKDVLAAYEGLLKNLEQRTRNDAMRSKQSAFMQTARRRAQDAQAALRKPFDQMLGEKKVNDLVAKLQKPEALTSLQTIAQQIAMLEKADAGLKMILSGGRTAESLSEWNSAIATLHEREQAITELKKQQAQQQAKIRRDVDAQLRSAKEMRLQIHADAGNKIAAQMLSGMQAADRIESQIQRLRSMMKNPDMTASEKGRLKAQADALVNALPGASRAAVEKTIKSQKDAHKGHAAPTAITMADASHLIFGNQFTRNPQDAAKQTAKNTQLTADQLKQLNATMQKIQQQGLLIFDGNP